MCQHHGLQPLNEEMQAQHDFWCSLSGTPLDGNLFYFDVLKVEATSYGLPLAETSAGRNTCFFHLDHAWAARAFTSGMLRISQQRLQKWKQHSQDRIPTLTLRVPKVIALLVLRETWSTLPVPESLHQVNLSAGWLSKHVLKTDTFKGFSSCDSDRLGMSRASEETTPDSFVVTSPARAWHGSVSRSAHDPKAFKIQNWQTTFSGKKAISCKSVGNIQPSNL